MRKRGELTTQQLITIIILIVSFGVLLFFIFRLNLGGDTTNKEICHNSVLMKSKSKIGGSALDCRTNYICISGGGKCEGFSATDTVEVDLDKKDKDGKSLAKDEVLKAVADEMADCWWMFGEGKVDYVDLSVKSETIGKVNCALCSRIKFDNKIQDYFESRPFFSSGELYKFMGVNNDGKRGTYLRYLYGISDYKSMKIDDSIRFDEEQIILTGIADKGVLTSVKESLFGSVDFINKIFFSFLPLPKAATYKDYGPIPVTIRKKEDMSKLECTNFLTKA